MAEPPRHRSVPLEIPVAALVGAASIPLSRLFQAGGLGAVVVSSIAASLAIAWAMRRLRLPTLVSMGISALALVWYASVAFVAETLWGPFPTMASLRALGELVDLGAAQAVDEIAPVAPSDALLVIVAAGVWVTTWVADGAAVRARSPLLTIVATIPLFALPGTILTGQRRWLDLGLFIAAGVMLLFWDERARALRWGVPIGLALPGWRSAPAVRLALVVGAVAVAVAPLLPGYGAPPGLRALTGGGGSRVVFNPLVAIKPTLDRSPDRILFTLETERKMYLRLTALEHFDGEVWTQRGRKDEQAFDGPIDPVSPAAGDVVIQDITIESLAGSWLPAAYEPIAIRGVRGVSIETGSRALLLDRPIDRGASYRVVSRAPSVTARMLDGDVSYDERALEPYLALPRRLPEEVREIAERVTRDETTPFGKARALQNYLRTFEYDEDVAAGHSFDTLVEFLTETQRGYCEQFAGAMAVLARTLEIPSRVVIGFAGGRRMADGTFWVTTEYAHAWVEIYFPQAGWIAFEPTPRGSIARVPDYALPERVGGEDPRAEPEPTETDPAEGRRPDDRPERDVDAGADPGQDQAGSAAGWLLPIGIAGVGLLVAGLVSARLLLRRRALHAARTPTEAAAVRYVDFLRWCAAAGYARRPGETPREHAHRLSRLCADAEEPLSRLSVLVEAAFWAPPDGLDPETLGAAAADAREALSARLPRRRRLLVGAGWGSWRAQP